MAQVSALICVYNGQDTISRALQSVILQVDKIVIIDDGSTDATVDIIKRFDPEKIHLKCLGENGGLGLARQHALTICQTEYAIWLDADDEFLPGRVSNLLKYLDEGADLVFDSSEVISNGEVKVRHVPKFIAKDRKLGYQLFRNFIPALAVPMFKVCAVKRVGYDASRNAEDYGFFLKGMLHNLDIQFSNSIGYREYESPESLSKQVGNQRLGMRNAINSLSVSDVKGYLVERDYGAHEITGITLLFLAQAGRWEDVVNAISQIDAKHGSPLLWLTSFLNGICAFKQGLHQQALEHFECAWQIQASPDLSNNMAACKKILGNSYCHDLEVAIGMNAGYLDAISNLKGGALTITELPLRTFVGTEQMPLPVDLMQ